MGIEAQLENAARQNLETALQESGESFTDLEKRAMVKIEELKLVNGMDLAAILLRGKLIHEIEDSALYSVHPEGYTTLQEMAQAQGISLSELSNVRDLVDVIFPYIENTLHVSVAQVWEEIGKSKFRELTSVLKAIITGERSGTASVNASVERLLDDTAATAQAAGQTLTNDELARETIQNLLLAGGQMPTVDLRRHIRPERTNDISVTFVRSGNRRLMIAEIEDEDQFTLINRQLGRHITPTTVFLPEDEQRRRSEAARVRILREINQLISGE